VAPMVYEETQKARPLHHRMMTYNDLTFFSPPKICQRGVRPPNPNLDKTPVKKVTASSRF
jgi:hypothetical protein